MKRNQSDVGKIKLSRKIEFKLFKLTGFLVCYFILSWLPSIITIYRGIVCKCIVNAYIRFGKIFSLTRNIE